MKICVSGEKTQQIFDKVFSKLVDAAQPIPGFRRVKGGKAYKNIFMYDFFKISRLVVEC